MDQQQHLPLDPRERLALVRAASSRLPLSAPRRHNVQLLLEKIEAHAASSLTKKFLADVMVRSVPTVKRAIKDAEETGVIVVARRPGHSGTQASNSYAIQWDALKALARGMVPRPQQASFGKTTHDPPGVQNEPGWGQFDPPGVQNDPHLARFLNIEPPLGGSKIQSTSSSFLPNREPQRAWCPGAHEVGQIDHGVSWREVEEELFSTGMGDVDGVLRRVRERCAPADVMAIIAHWRSKPGAWGLGALHKRLRFASPGGDPAACWVPESDAWRREQNRTAQTAYAQERRRHELAEQAAAAKQQAALDQLEAAYGATLDALSADELAGLAAEAFGHCANPAFYHTLLRRSGNDRTNTNLRPLLLEALQRRRVPSLEASDAQVPR